MQPAKVKRMQPKFQRCKENFVCGRCGFETKGNGYTNHCARCLWSRHVDINPGDRASTCGEFMEPVQIHIRRGWRYLEHKCLGCGARKLNRVAPNDNEQAIWELMEHFARSNL